MASTTFPLRNLRRLRSALLGGRPGRYRTSEVRALLSPRAEGDTDRRRAVLATAAIPSSWAGYLREEEIAELGRVAWRLPTVVFWYQAGASVEEIGGRLGGFGGEWRARRALQLAARCIARRLNDRGLPAVRGAV